MDKQENEIYCPECAKPINKDAVVCVNCGVQIKPLATSIPSETAPSKPKPNKSRMTAQLLAVFIPIFTWTYTWQKDWYKFLIGIILVIMSIIIVSVSDAWYATWLVGIGTFIWALVDTSKKPKSWYDNYPNG